MTLEQFTEQMSNEFRAWAVYRDRPVEAWWLALEDFAKDRYHVEVWAQRRAQQAAKEQES